MPFSREVGRSQSDIVLNRDPAPLPQKGGRALSQHSAHDYCGQTVGWMKMPLGTEVDLSAGHIVLDGDPVPPERCTAASFRPISVVAKWMDGSRCHLVGR